jgi:hypothetical protein
MPARANGTMKFFRTDSGVAACSWSDGGARGRFSVGTAASAVERSAAPHLSVVAGTPGSVQTLARFARGTAEGGCPYAGFLDCS